MAQRSARRLVRRVSGGVWVAAALAACGGSELFAILQIVTPLGGSWNDDNGEALFFSSPPEADQMFVSKLAVTARVTSSKGVCGATLNNPVDDVPGTLDNGKLTLRLPNAVAPCLEGSFTDLRRFEGSAPGLSAKIAYLNDRVAVKMQAGLWSSEDGKLKLKFQAPDSVFNLNIDGSNTEAVLGCDLSNAATPVSFTGTMSGFNTTTLAKPTIPALLGTTFTQVEFVDGATLKMLHGGQSVTLTRKDDTTTTCPAV